MYVKTVGIFPSRRDHVPFLGYHVEISGCAQDFVTVLVLGRNLFKNEPKW
jgi:hypothetical protein